MNSANTDYSSVANLYDSLGHLYSGGQIAATKASQINHISTGDRVLYAGVGGGEDARLAAKAGAKVTVVDLSQAMLDRAIVGFERAGVRDDIEVICGDIMEHARHGHYDVVVANFFLNVFDTELMPQVMKHLALQLRDGGTFMIADFRRSPTRGWTAGQQPTLGVPTRCFVWSRTIHFTRSTITTSTCRTTV